jgi:hypothetical protein
MLMQNNNAISTYTLVLLGYQIPQWGDIVLKNKNVQVVFCSFDLKSKQYF